MLGLARTVAHRVKGAGVHAPKWTEKPTVWKHVHAVFTALWFLAVLPTVLWWRDSVMWVALMSCWANAAAHFSAWQGSRAEAHES